MKRILVTGSREFTNKELIYNILIKHVPDDGLLVHGDCPRGADAIAKMWAMEYGCPQEPHPANWKRPNGSVDNGAGFKRNVEMAKLGADLCLAFWDGVSNGTLHMIQTAVQFGIKVIIIPIRPGSSVG